ncbi:hypothetical protein TNCV_4557391 [Trichonephila clavipes]|nr:hypothetical protein TNCV_4557391 [Trichonephila clavipes]
MCEVHWIQHIQDDGLDGVWSGMLAYLDFFLWDHMKSFVFASPVDSVEALVERIAIVAGDIRVMTGALIEYNGVIIGSGALVSPKFVLTAASIFQARNKVVSPDKSASDFAFQHDVVVKSGPFLCVETPLKQRITPVRLHLMYDMGTDNMWQCLTKAACERNRSMAKRVLWIFSRSTEDWLDWELDAATLMDYGRSGTDQGHGSSCSPEGQPPSGNKENKRMLKDLDKMTVFLGKHKTTVHSESHEKIFNVKVVHFHIRYNIPTIHNNDLALIELKTPAEDKYRPICLPQRKEEYFPNTVLTIAGWGGEQERSPLSHFLQKADMKVLSYGVCKDKYPKWFNKRMICVHSEEVDACKQNEIRNYCATAFSIMIRKKISNYRKSIKGMKDLKLRAVCAKVLDDQPYFKMLLIEFAPPFNEVLVKPTEKVSHKVKISIPTVWTILRKKLKSILYKMQLLQNLRL